MSLAAHEFGAALLAEVRPGRSFGRHPLWLEIAAGRCARARLQEFARQFYLQVLEFPRAVSALHSRCPDRGERLKLAESLYEEETGRLSGTKPHPDLFLDFCAALGLDRDDVRRTPPLPATAALVHWFEVSSKLLPFIEGVAAITLAAEGQVAGNFAPFARALEQHYRLAPAAVAFWDVHEEADAEHADVGDHIVLRHATTAAAQEGVRAAVRTSLALWWQFFDGIHSAGGAG